MHSPRAFVSALPFIPVFSSSWPVGTHMWWIIRVTFDDSLMREQAFWVNRSRQTMKHHFLIDLDRNSCSCQIFFPVQLFCWKYKKMMQNSWVIFKYRLVSQPLVRVFQFVPTGLAYSLVLLPARFRLPWIPWKIIIKSKHGFRYWGLITIFQFDNTQNWCYEYFSNSPLFRFLQAK